MWALNYLIQDYTKLTLLKSAKRCLKIYEVRIFTVKKSSNNKKMSYFAGSLSRSDDITRLFVKCHVSTDNFLYKCN